jgi:quinohemoprotein ethanol dehydrogenase
VLMQAPKNGFFYVLDRATGRLLSARNFVPVTWATHVDLATGRPVETPEARFYARPGATVELRPMNLGGHNWHPMAFDPRLGLAFIPTWDIGLEYRADPDFRFDPGFSSTGVDLGAYASSEDANILERTTVALVAWDAASQREAWRVALPAPAPGGALATAGGLVFAGDGAGGFHAFRSRDGARLWSFDAQSPIAAGPVSFAAGGEQHVAVMSRDRLLAFRLDGEGALPPAPTPAPEPRPEPPARTAGAAEVALGRRVFNQHCLVCHGVNAVGIGTAPDLRRAAPATHAAWDAIVRDGARRALGMPAFGRLLRQDEIDASHAYVIERAWALAGAR